MLKIDLKRPVGFATLGLLGLLGLFGCEDDSSDDKRPDTGDGGHTGAADSGSTHAVDGGGMDSGNAAPPTCDDGQWILGGWTTTQDVEHGYLHSLDDLTARSRIDFGTVESFDGDFNYKAYPDGVAFVGQDGKSTLQRWELQRDGSWMMTRQGDLLNQGVTSTMSEVQRVNGTKAYYFDTENNQVVGFNPETMLHDGVVIDLTPAFGPPSDFMNMTRLHRDGDVFIVAARYWNEDYSVKKSIQAAFIDSNDDSVTFAEETRCGGTFYNATDAAGNLYLGSHVSNLFDRIAGSESDASDSCIVRIKKGEKQFDGDYYVDMGEVLGGLGATLIDGPGDTAFIEKYEGPELTADNFTEARLGAHWDVYSITLGDEAKTAAKVELPERTIAYGNGFVTRCGGRETGFLVMADAEFAAGQLFQVIDSTKVEGALKYTGSIGEVTRID
jgi:hypothetical protein